MKQIKVAINGQCGKMGQELTKVINADLELALVDFTSNPEVIIDFSHPNATLSILDWCLTNNCPIIIGTTGFNSEQNECINFASKKIPILKAANTSAGLNLLLPFVKNLAMELPKNIEIGIVEKHHKNKIDAPSGTALALGQAINDARIKSSKPTIEINYSSLRLGEIVGEHTIEIHMPGEVISIGHKVASRASFAHGAVSAAKKLLTYTPGLYEFFGFIAYIFLPTS